MLEIPKKTLKYFKPYIFNTCDKLFNKKVLNNSTEVNLKKGRNAP